MRFILKISLVMVYCLISNGARSPPTNNISRRPTVPYQTGHGPHSSNRCVVLCIVCFVSFYVLFVLYRSMYCLCVNVYYCHRVTTQLQLTNISYNIISN